jgi:hypothetical protein
VPLPAGSAPGGEGAGSGSGSGGGGGRRTAQQLPEAGGATGAAEPTEQPRRARILIVRVMAQHCTARTLYEPEIVADDNAGSFLDFLPTC